MIVHPDRLFREALAVALASQHRTIQVVGWAGAVDHLRQVSPVSLASHCPDVILLGGVQRAAEIMREITCLRSTWLTARILILSRPPVTHDTHPRSGESVGPGEVSLRDLLQRIQHLSRGEHSLPGITNEGTGSPGIPAEPAAQESGSQLTRLTRREQEILILRRQGRSNKEIGAVLQIELQTVKNHLRSIFAKAQHARQRQEGPVTAIPSRPH